MWKSHHNWFHNIDNFSPSNKLTDFQNQDNQLPNHKIAVILKSECSPPQLQSAGNNNTPTLSHTTCNGSYKVFSPTVKKSRCRSQEGTHSKNPAEKRVVASQQRARGQARTIIHIIIWHKQLCMQTRTMLKPKHDMNLEGKKQKVSSLKILPIVFGKHQYSYAWQCGTRPSNFGTAGNSRWMLISAI